MRKLLSSSKIWINHQQFTNLSFIEIHKNYWKLDKISNCKIFLLFKGKMHLGFSKSFRVFFNFCMRLNYSHLLIYGSGLGLVSANSIPTTGLRRLPFSHADDRLIQIKFDDPKSEPADFTENRAVCAQSFSKSIIMFITRYIIDPSSIPNKYHI